MAKRFYALALFLVAAQAVLLQDFFGNYPWFLSAALIVAIVFSAAALGSSRKSFASNLAKLFFTTIFVFGLLLFIGFVVIGEALQHSFDIQF